MIKENLVQPYINALMAVKPRVSDLHITVIRNEKNQMGVVWTRNSIPLTKVLIVDKDYEDTMNEAISRMVGGKCTTS